MSKVDFVISSEWTTGFTGSMKITNDGTTPVDRWRLEFDAPFNISVIWDGQILSKQGNHYVIDNASWNSTIPIGGSVSFGFNGDKPNGVMTAPVNYILNGQSLNPNVTLPKLSLGDLTVTEGDSGSFVGNFQVKLSSASQDTVTVNYATANITALSGSDYIRTTGILTFAPGQTIKNLGVGILGDTISEARETFAVNLTQATKATILDGQGIGTIIDNDVAPSLPQITVNDISITEGNTGIQSGLFTVKLSKASQDPITVRYATSNGTATAGSDYRAISGVLTFAAGQTSRTVKVEVIGDTIVEGSEKFNFNLINPTKATISDNLGVATITNNDVTIGNRKYVVGAYYPEWGTYDRNYQIADVPADKLTHLFYAFAKIDGNGQVALFDSYAATEKSFPGDTWDQSLRGNFNQLKKLKQQNPNLKTMISVGGWTLSSGFSDAALTDASRQKFAQSAISFMTTYGFDGIDLDWEYPVGGGLEGNKNRPEDKHNYTLLLAELDKQIKAKEAIDRKDYQLSIASPAGYDKMANFELGAMNQYLDFFNVMAYDYHGAWENTTNHQAPLYANPSDPSSIASKYNIDWTIKNYIQAGVEPSKIVMGAPAYGRAWKGVGSANNGLFRPASGAASGTWEAGIIDYKDLYNRLATQPDKYTRYWDSAAQVPYIYSPNEGGTFSTYEDRQSLTLKTDYVKNHSLGGTFFWDASSDLRSGSDSLINIAASNLNPTI